MPQDYAKKSRSSNKPSPKRRAAKPQPAPRRVVPGWIWLVVGVLVGAFVMFLVRLSDVEPGKSSKPNTPAPDAHVKPKPASALPPKRTQATAPKNAAPKKADQQPKQAAKQKPSEQAQKPRFDFYKMLKENEVPVFAAPDDGTSKPTKPRTFILQVASFKSAADAEQLKVELILLGLESKAERVVVRNGEVWNRVLVGPFNDRSKLSKARNKLISNGHQALVMAYKADAPKAQK